METLSSIAEFTATSWRRRLVDARNRPKVAALRLMNKADFYQMVTRLASYPPTIAR
jgi:hypothetical protein